MRTGELGACARSRVSVLPSIFLIGSTRFTADFAILSPLSLQRLPPRGRTAHSEAGGTGSGKRGGGAQAE